MASAGSHASDVDVRISTNPVLQELHDDSPETASKVLEQLDRIIRGEQADEFPKWKSRGNLALPKVLDVNPTIREAYRRDPRATAKLIGIIRPAN